MLDIKLLRENPQTIEGRLRTRDPSLSLHDLLQLDEQRRALIQQADDLKRRQNEASQKIATLKREKNETEAQQAIAQMGAIADEVKRLDHALASLETQLQDAVAQLPNIPHESVPVSQNKGDKKTLRQFKNPPPAEHKVKSHLEIGEELGILDFPRGAKIAGSRFPLYKGKGAMLEMALIQYMLKFHVDQRGYTPVFPPYLGNAQSLFTSSQLPKFKDDVYYIEKDDLYLNPTAEVLLANLHRDEMLEGEQLPIKYCAYTACFRREAGTYGEEEKGLIRMHQFNKVELFVYARPEDSFALLEKLVEDAEALLKTLDLHYRVALLPTCDIAQQSAKTIDLELWLPSQKRYFEVSSCSNCTDFQARRGNIRFRREKGAKPEFVHMLNGSGVATSRLVGAILENNQGSDGSVVIPKPLQDYVGTDRLTR